MSQRTQQVASTLKKLVSQVLAKDLSDPRLDGAMISITKVDISPDMKHASLAVSVAPERHQSRVMHALTMAARHIQKLVRDRSSLRTVPHLTFRLDPSLKKQAEVLAAINRGMDRVSTPEEPAEDAQSPADESAHEPPPQQTPDLSQAPSPDPPSAQASPGSAQEEPKP
jgi:ribosome-binding factor A